MKYLNINNLVNKTYVSCMIMLLIAAMTGCSNGMEVVDQNRGKSVRLMEQSQVYDKAAAQNPSPNAPLGISGNKSLADLHDLERPVNAERGMLNLIKAQKYEVGGK